MTRGWHGDKKEHSETSKKGLEWKAHGIPKKEFTKKEKVIKTVLDLRIERAEGKFVRDETRLKSKYKKIRI